MVESCNEVTAASIFGKAKPVAVHENNNGNTKLTNTGLKSNITLGAHILDEKEGWFMDGLTSMMGGMITPIHLQTRMNWGAHTRSRVTTAFLNSPKPNTTEDQKEDS